MSAGAVKRALRRRLGFLRGNRAWPWLQRLGRMPAAIGAVRRGWARSARARLGRLRRAALSPDPEYQEFLDLAAPLPAARAAPGPSLAVVLWVPPGAEESGARTIASVRSQGYSRWTLCEARGPDRALAVNEALRGAGAEALVFVEAGDTLAPGALEALAQAAPADLIYGDEDRLLLDGPLPTVERPFMKPGWSPDILLSAPYPSGAMAIARAHFEAVGGLRPGFGEHDLLLRLLPLLTRVAHVERVLYHRASAGPEVSPAAVREHVRRAYGASFDWRAGQLVFEGEPSVSVIVPFKDQPHLLRELTESIFARTQRGSFELVLVSNNSAEPATFALLEELARRPNVRVLRWDQSFNWSAVNNFAARQCRSELLLFLNNDMQVADGRWLSALAAHAMRPDVCATGTKLVYPDRTIQHSGVVVGMTGFAGHVFAGGGEGMTCYGPTGWIRNFAAVTGACLMVRRALFESVGGFDERFVLCGSDVEFCLRARRQTGGRVVCVPEPLLVHYESRSRGREIPFNDFQQSYAHYQPLFSAGDPYYNRSLSLLSTQPRLRLEPEDALELAHAVLEDARP